MTWIRLCESFLNPLHNLYIFGRLVPQFTSLTDCCFTLDWIHSTFMLSTCPGSRAPFSDYLKIILSTCPGLISTFLGVDLSTSGPSEERRSQEHILLLRALKDTTTDLATTHPHHVLQTIQAETLLAYSLFCSGNILKPRRASSAASLVISCRLHKIRSS